MSIITAYFLSTAPMSRAELAVWLLCGAAVFTAVLIASRGHK